VFGLDCAVVPVTPLDVGSLSKHGTFAWVENVLCFKSSLNELNKKVPKNPEY
jgi:hypothetical protein